MRVWSVRQALGTLVSCAIIQKRDHKCPGPEVMVIWDCFCDPRSRDSMSGRLQLISNRHSRSLGLLIRNPQHDSSTLSACEVCAAVNVSNTTITRANVFSSPSPYDIFFITSGSNARSRDEFEEPPAERRFGDCEHADTLRCGAAAFGRSRSYVSDTLHDILW